MICTQSMGTFYFAAFIVILGYPLEFYRPKQRIHPLSLKSLYQIGSDEIKFEYQLQSQWMEPHQLSWTRNADLVENPLTWSSISFVDAYVWIKICIIKWRGENGERKNVLKCICNKQWNNNMYLPLMISLQRNTPA